MVFTPDSPFPKSQGNPILSKDWNAAINEVVRLEGAKVNRAGDAVTGSLTISGNLGVGTNNPGTRLHVAGGGTIRWGNNSELVADQGGSIELGGNNSTPGTGSPYIDFHFSGLTQDFNTRITNDANGRLSLIAPTLRTTGNVGIGTAGPDRPLTVQGSELISLRNATGATKWHINDRGGTGDLNIAESGVADARLYLRAGGNVGIGTTTPRTTLEVRGHLTLEAGGSPVLFTGTGTSELNRHLALINSPDSTSASGLKAGGVLVSDTYAYANPSKNDLIVKGSVGVGTATPQFGRLMIEDGAVPLSLRETGQAVTQGGLWRMPLDAGILRFDVNTAAAGDFSSYVTPVAMNAAGNVGIGTTTPGAKLQVSGGAIMPAVGNSRNAGIQFPLDPGGGGGDEAFIRYFAESGETTKLLIGCLNDADDRISFHQFGSERLTIFNGNVGIGTTSPGAKLDVSGSGGATQCCAPVTPTLSLAEASSTANRQAWLQFHNAGEAESYVRLAGGGPAGSGRDGQRRLEIGDSQGASTGLRIVSGALSLPKTTDGYAELSNYQGGFLDTSAGTVRLRMSDQPLDTPLPTYSFGVGHSMTFRFFSGIVSAFQTKFSVNQNGDATVARNLQVSGNLSVAGTKTGYVADNFINGVGDTLEQGDVLVIASTDTSHYSGTDNNIPLIEADLTDTAYDSRVCGIVASVVTENELPYVEETQAPSLEDVARGANATEAAVRKAVELGVNPFEVEGTGSGGRVIVGDIETAVEEGEVSSTSGLTEAELGAYLNPLTQFAGEITPESDVTKIEDQQMGRMVTLGAFAHCKVDADIAPISAGDLLTTSPTRGHAQKVLEQEKAAGAIIGKALASLDGGKGKIPVLVMLQ